MREQVSQFERQILVLLWDTFLSLTWRQKLVPQRDRNWSFRETEIGPFGRHICVPDLETETGPSERQKLVLLWDTWLSLVESQQQSRTCANMREQVFTFWETEIGPFVRHISVPDLETEIGPSERQNLVLQEDRNRSFWETHICPWLRDRNWSFRETKISPSERQKIVLLWDTSLSLILSQKQVPLSDICAVLDSERCPSRVTSLKILLWSNAHV